MVLAIISFIKRLKLVHYLAIAFILICLFCLFLLRITSDLRHSNTRLRNNNATLYSTLNDERTKSGNLMSRVGILELEKKEIKEFYKDEVMSALEDMQVRLRRLETFSSTSVESTHVIETTLKDSVRVVDMKLEPIKYIDYKSEFLDFYQVQAGDQVKTIIHKRDSLIQVVYRPAKDGFFLARIFKKKPPLEQKITSADPNSVIKYNLYIKPVKKRRRDKR